MEARPVELKVLIISVGSVLLVEATFRAIAYTSMPLLAGARFVETVLILSTSLIFGQGLSDFGLGRSVFLSGLKQGLLWAGAFGVLSALLLGLLLMLGHDPLAMIRTRLPLGKGASFFSNRRSGFSGSRRNLLSGDSVWLLQTLGSGAGAGAQHPCLRSRPLSGPGNSSDPGRRGPCLCCFL